MLVQIQPTPKLIKYGAFRTGLPPSLILLSLSGGMSATCDHVSQRVCRNEAAGRLRLRQRSSALRWLYQDAPSGRPAMTSDVQLTRKTSNLLRKTSNLLRKTSNLHARRPTYYGTGRRGGVAPAR